MSDWDPELYSRFEDERTRPARDLLAQVFLPESGLIVDLGCGPGNSTALLAARFPQATITGIDTSEAMLARAAERLPACRFERADIAAWVPDQPPDLLYANASLQWLDDHPVLLPRLFEVLGPGGVLAIQMPDNRDEASHRLMREVARLPAFAEAIGPAASLRVPVLTLAAYYDLLAPWAATVEVWRTVYHHPMASAADIVTWLRGTGLRPFLDRLTEAEQGAFIEQYQSRIDRAYPAQADGKRLLAFPRLFMVARRPGA